MRPRGKRDALGREFPWDGISWLRILGVFRLRACPHRGCSSSRGAPLNMTEGDRFARRASPPPCSARGVAVKLLQFNNMWGPGTLFIRRPARVARRPCAERKLLCFFVSQSLPWPCSPLICLGRQRSPSRSPGPLLMADSLKINFQRPQRPEAPALLNA